MSIALLLTSVLALATDPTSARAVASRNERLIVEGEAALAEHDGPTALARALVVDDDDRRLDRPRLLLLRGRARALVGLANDAVTDLRAARDATAATGGGSLKIQGLGREIAVQERARGAFDACADELAGEFGDAPTGDDDALLWATCLRATSRRPLAHDVLVGHDGPAVRHLRATMLLEDGLPRLARHDVAALVDDLVVDDLLAFARAFRSQGDPDFADALVNAAMARFPDDAVVADVATTAATAVNADASAALTRRAALVSGGHPDGLRSVGLPGAAWRAALLSSGSDRLRQRLALLVDARAWERVVLLAPRLRAAGLLKADTATNDDVAYAVAFANAATGRLDDAEAALDGVGTSAGFTRATELRAAIAACRAAGPDQQETRCPR
jgi:hypothetical protein